MIPALHRFGSDAIPVLTVDGIGPPVAGIVETAAALTPFPPAVNNYPGLRRMISPVDHDAYSYILNLLDQARPFIGGAFDIDAFDLIDASFSMVTTSPADLSPVQRAPHFDAVGRTCFAVLHYLSETEGTAFYRHRATGIETVTEDNFRALVAAMQCSSPLDGYISENTDSYEQIGAVSGLAGRLIAYPCNVLHSRIITEHFVPDADPRTSRLTANIFIAAR